MNTPIHILGFAGSVRASSWNRGLLRAAAELLPRGATLETFDLAALPFYNQDLDTPEARPDSVAAFKDAIRAADALLIATPEYNYSIPGLLKNAIEWASRPPSDSPLSGKPLAIMGAGGAYGTVRAQLHLRQVAASAGLLTLAKPEVLIQRGWEKFDAGNLADEPSREAVRGLLDALAVWTRRLRGE